MVRTTLTDPCQPPSLRTTSGARAIQHGVHHSADLGTAGAAQPRQRVSICVAVMTRLTRQVALQDEMLLVVGTFATVFPMPRSPRATMMPVAEIRISSKLSSASAFSTLGDNRQPIPEIGHRPAQSEDILRRTDEGLRKVIYACPMAKARSLPGLVCYCRQFEVSTDQRRALVGLQHTTGHNFAPTFSPRPCTTSSSNKPSSSRIWLRPHTGINSA